MAQKVLLVRSSRRTDLERFELERKKLENAACWMRLMDTLDPTWRIEHMQLVAWVKGMLCKVDVMPLFDVEIENEHKLLQHFDNWLCLMDKLDPEWRSDKLMLKETIARCAVLLHLQFD